MKTRRFATTLERGRVDVSRAQAKGFVSRIIVSKDGGGAVRDGQRHLPVL